MNRPRLPAHLFQPPAPPTPNTVMVRAIVPTNTMAPPNMAGLEVSPIDILTPMSLRPSATVYDIEMWKSLPIEVRALAYRVLWIAGIRP